MAINGGNDVKLCQEALNELTDLVQNSKKAFFTADNVIVNRQTMMEIIDRIYSNLPDALASARSIIDQQEQILTQARQESDDTVGKAKAEARRLTEEAQAALQKAQGEAQQMHANAQQAANDLFQQAQAEAQNIRLKADQDANMKAAEAENLLQQKVSENNVFQVASVKAEELRQSTENELRELKEKTFQYLDGVMNDIERYTNDLAQDIRIERSELNKRR